MNLRTSIVASLRILIALMPCAHAGDDPCGDDGGKDSSNGLSAQ